MYALGMGLAAAGLACMHLGHAFSPLHLARSPAPQNSIFFSSSSSSSPLPSSSSSSSSSRLYYIPSSTDLASSGSAASSFFHLYDKSALEIDGDRRLLQTTDMLLVTPLEQVSMEDIGALNKYFSADTRKEVINASNLRLIVDGTPHVLVSNEAVSGLYYTIFIEKESQRAYDSFMKWIRSVQSRGEEYDGIVFYVSKRFHLIKI
jgi:hypothetical protein